MSEVIQRVDLSTDYLGLRLHSPIVAAAGPATGDPRLWERLERSGAGAIVLPSLFQEQIENGDEFALPPGADPLDPDFESYDAAPNPHLALVEQARERLSIPVIASLNGSAPGGWLQYARFLERAGAHAVELNLYDIVVDPRQSAADVEQRYLDLVEEVRAEVTVPLAVKLGPWFTSLGHFARELEGRGVDGLVLFNRLYQPDIDLDTLEMEPRLLLSTSAETRLPMHWIGILREFLSCSIAATSGVHEGADVMKLMLAGADVVMVASALLRHGPARIASILEWMRDWMTARGYADIAQLRGLVSRGSVPDPDAYERAHYYEVLRSWRR